MPRDSLYGPNRGLVTQNKSALIQQTQIKRSTFMNRWTRKTAFDAGKLVPILIQQILPGDHVRYNISAFVRMHTPVFPLYDNLEITTFFFFCPMRLLWENTEKFFGAQKNPGDSIAFTIPTIDIDVATAGTTEGINSIWDHMGIPLQNLEEDAFFTINVLPFRMYNLCWNEWFRDQNIQASLEVPLDQTSDLAAYYAIQNRAKPHDYFTGALPAPQKFTAPTVPLGTLAPVKGIGTISADGTVFDVPVYETGANDVGDAVNYPQAIRAWNGGVNGDDRIWVKKETLGTATGPAIYADLAAASGIAINVFRQAFLIQELLERDMRSGTRYTETIRAHFDVINPDFRLQRPEYIGGGKTPLITTPIAQTAPTDGANLGTLGGATTAAGNHSASYAATEWGYILGLINVHGDISYQQGLHRMWTALTRYEMFYPTLAGLGEQAVLRQEIYATGDGPGNDHIVFGYQARYEEYRTVYNEVTGLMRSGYTGTLDAWHLAQNFLDAPTLSTAFIEDRPPMARVLAAGDLAVNQQFLADIEFHRTITRAVPLFGNPVSLSRF